MPDNNEQRIYATLRAWIDDQTLAQAQLAVVGAIQVMAVQLLGKQEVTFSPASSGGGGGGTGPHMVIRVPPPPPPPVQALLQSPEGTLALLQVALALEPR